MVDMEDHGFGKAKSLGSKHNAKPYARPTTTTTSSTASTTVTTAGTDSDSKTKQQQNKSILHQMTDSVKNLLTPSWLTSLVSGSKEDVEQQKRDIAGTAQSLPQQIKQPDTHAANYLDSYHNGIPSEQIITSVDSTVNYPLLTNSRTPDNVAQPVVTNSSYIPQQQATYGLLDNPYSRTTLTSGVSRHSLPTYSRQPSSVQHTTQVSSGNNKEAERLDTSSSQADNSSSFVTVFTKAPRSSVPDRSNQTTGKANTSLNISSFASSFNASLSESMLKNKSLSESLYYPGKTVYGGMASNRSIKLPNSSPYCRTVTASRKQSILPKGKTSVSSKAAKAILNAINNTGMTSSQNASFDRGSYNAGIYLRRKATTANNPPVTKIQSKEKAKITPNVQSVLFGSNGKVTGSATTDIPARHPSKATGGKLRRERSSHYSSRAPLEEELLVENPLSTGFILPITTLPTFNFGKTSDEQKLTGKRNQENLDSFQFVGPETVKVVEVPVPVCDTEFHFHEPSDAKAVNNAKHGSKRETKSVSNVLQSDNVNQSSGWGDLFKKTDGQWTCTVCMVSNSKEKMQCVACNTKKTLLEKEIPKSTECSSTLQTSSVTTLPTSGWGNLITKPSEQWTCSTCLVENVSDKSSCVACGTKDSSGLRTTSALVTTAAQASGWGDLLAKQNEKWSCNVCMIQNEKSSSSCMACGTKNSSGLSTTSALVTTAAQASGWGDLLAKQNEKWSCNVCMVQNEKSSSSCMACGTKNSAAASTKSATMLSTNLASPSQAPPAANWGNLIATPTGQWSCDTCLVSNPSSAQKCLACGEKNANFLSTKAPSTSATSGWGDLLAKQSQKWSCSVCMVQNDNDKRRCVVCNTENLATNSKSTNNENTDNTDINIEKTSNADVPQASGWGDLFKSQSKKWTCDVCMVQNDSEKSKCLACGSANPGAVAHSDLTGTAVAGWGTPAAAGKGWGSIGQTGNKWSCNVCLVANDADRDACIACSTRKSGIDAETSKPLVQQWNCSVCMVSNPVTLSFCKSCNACKPGTQSSFGDISKGKQLPLFEMPVPAVTKALQTQISSSTDVTSTSPTEAPSTAGFSMKFGSSDTEKTGAPFVAFPMKFGSGEKTTNKSDASQFFTKFGSTTPTVATTSTSTLPSYPTAFGSTSGLSTTKKSEQNVSSGFSLPSGGYKFGSQEVQPESTDSKLPSQSAASSAPSELKFGMNSVKPVETSEVTATTESFSITAPQSTMGFSFGASTSSAPVTGTTSSFPVAKFDSSSLTKTTASSTFGSGFTFQAKPTSVPTSSSSPAALLFGSTPNTAAETTVSSGFASSVFGKAAPTTTVFSSGPVFSATDTAAAGSKRSGEPYKMRSKTENFDEPTPGFEYGASASTAPAASTANVFGSGAQASSIFGSTAPVFGSAATAPPSVGFQFAAQPVSAQPTFNFVSNAAAAPASGGLFQFGASNSSTPVLGANAGGSSAATPTFGAPAADETTRQPPTNTVPTRVIKRATRRIPKK